MPLKLACFWQEPLLRGGKELRYRRKREKKKLLKEVKGPRPPIYPYLGQWVNILFEGAFQFSLPEFSRDIYQTFVLVSEKNGEKFREK